MRSFPREVESDKERHGDNEKSQESIVHDFLICTLHLDESDEENPIEDEEEAAKSGISFCIVPSFLSEIELFIRIAEFRFEEILELCATQNQHENRNSRRLRQSHRNDNLFNFRLTFGTR